MRLIDRTCLEHSFKCPGRVNRKRVRRLMGLMGLCALKEKGIRISMDGKGRWRNGTFVERLWRSLKYEEVHLKAYESVGMAKAEMQTYFSLL